LNSYEGNYITQESASPDSETTVVLRYCDADGALAPGANPNGSMHAVAGIANGRGNVAGLMPHPERAIEDILGSSDGRVLFESFAASISSVNA
jgi:phosphoribosylformylglycinamidine synthase